VVIDFFLITGTDEGMGVVVWIKRVVVWVIGGRENRGVASMIMGSTIVLDGK
jgi:hypothetical protein